jgi:hypothetical protein
MSRVQQASKWKSRTKAVTVLGVAGALSLAGGASGAAVGPPGATLTTNTAVTLYEEEISDVSLSTSTPLTTKALEHVALTYNLLRGRAGRAKVAEAAQETAEEAPHAALPAQPGQAALSDVRFWG